MTLCQTFIGCSLFLFSINVMASSECPPIADIRNIKIIKTEKAGTYWAVMSNDFKYNEIDWNVLFAVNLPNIIPSSQSTNQIETYLKKVDLHEPIPHSIRGGVIICIYAETIEEKHSMIIASNPPIH